MGAVDQTLVAMLGVAAERLGAYGYLLTGSQVDGEELVQDAIVKVFSRRRPLQGVPQAEAYVRATMRTMHVDRIRREATWRRLLPRQARSEWTPDEADAVAARDAVARALATLPRQQRTAVVLRYYDDLSYAQIAETMRLSLGTVKRYLSDAMAALGEHVELSAEDATVVERRDS